MLRIDQTARLKSSREKPAIRYTVISQVKKHLLKRRKVKLLSNRLNNQRRVDKIKSKADKVKQKMYRIKIQLTADRIKIKIRIMMMTRKVMKKLISRCTASTTAIRGTSCSHAGQVVLQLPILI